MQLKVAVMSSEGLDVMPHFWLAVIGSRPWLLARAVFPTRASTLEVTLNSLTWMTFEMAYRASQKRLLSIGDN